MPTATVEVRVDDRGRITIPQDIRERLGIEQSKPTRVEVEVRADE